MPTHYLILQFDDDESQYEHALDIMRSYGYKGVLSVPTYFIGRPDYVHVEGMVCRKVDPTPRMELRPMTWDQVREFARAGWEIASHSKWHTCLGTDEPTIMREVYESYDDLARMGFPPTTFCAPGGFTGYTWATYEVKWAQTRYRFISGLGIGDPEINPIVRSGLLLSRGLTAGRYYNLHKVPGWLDELKRRGGIMILIFHRLYPEPKEGDEANNLTPEQFTWVLDQVKARRVNVVRYEDLAVEHAALIPAGVGIATITGTILYNELRKAIR